jgi:diketogulonate reductase-like aldo/keto reductase
MKFKILGNTLLNVPEIGFGTWNYQGGVEPLRKAIALGATLIDTAESYGTEEIVGAAIKGIREQVFLATKVSPKNFRRADLIAAAERSLKRLQTDYIDLYQLHWPNYTIPIEETMAAMEELVDAGKVRFVGVSRFFVSDLKKAQTALRKHKIVSNEVRYSLVERTCDPELLDYCEREQITIIAFSPLGQNFLYLRKNDQGDALGQVATETGKTRAQVALNWCVTKTGVIAIVKANSIEHVVEDCGASGWRLAPEHVKLLDQQIKFRKRGPLEMTFRRFVQHFAQMTGRNLELMAPEGLQAPDPVSDPELRGESLEEIHGNQVG